jgi:hypothetical protein
MTQKLIFGDIALSSQLQNIAIENVGGAPNLVSRAIQSLPQGLMVRGELLCLPAREDFDCEIGRANGFLASGVVLELRCG